MLICEFRSDVRQSRELQRRRHFTLRDRSHSARMPEASRGSQNINERYAAAMQHMGGGYKRESVVVVVDATDDELNLEGLDWALLNVVEPGRNELIVLGIFQEAQPYFQIWGFGPAFICCSPRSFRDRKLNQKISQKMEAFNLALQDSVLLQQRDGAKVHVRITAGFTPLHIIALQETSALSASWVVIDRGLKAHKKYFSEQMSCNVVMMKSKSEADVLRIHQELDKSNKSPMDDVSLDSIMLADISRAIQFQEKEYMDAYGEAPSPRRQHQGPTALPPKRPYYHSPKVQAPAKEFYRSSFSFRTDEPSIDVSQWMEPNQETDDETKAYKPEESAHLESDTDQSYTTPSPLDPRANANTRTLTQAVRNRFLQEPRVSTEPPSPVTEAPIPAPTDTQATSPLVEGYFSDSSDASSESEPGSEHGGRTPVGLSSILQDQRTRQPGLKRLTVATFSDERALPEEEDPASPSASVISVAPTEQSTLDHLDFPAAHQPWTPPQRPTSGSSSPRSSYQLSPHTPISVASSRSSKRNQQQTSAAVQQDLPESPSTSAGYTPPSSSRGLHLSAASSVRSDSPAFSWKTPTYSSDSPTQSVHSTARSTRSSRSSMRDPKHAVLLSPPRFDNFPN